MKVHKHLILASASPRRHHLLRQVGLEFEVRESSIDEPVDDSQSPEHNVLRISLDKARAVVRPEDDAIVIGADTVVVLDGQILGKPRDTTDAVHMLRRLSGRIHVVYTGFTLLDAPSQKAMQACEETSVRFRRLAEDEIEEYVASGSPMDKAGSYGIQDDAGAVFVERVEGCFYNVVGFPLTRFYTTMMTFQQQLGLM